MAVECTKNFKRIGLILVGVLIINFVNAQELKVHQWENRILLIISSIEDSKEFLTQMTEFNGLTKDLEERKLLTYQILPLKYRTVNYPEQNEWIPSSLLFTKYAGKGDNFKIILIGLDGGIKLERTDVLKATELFGTIDSMPMRKAEMINKNR